MMTNFNPPFFVASAPQLPEPTPVPGVGYSRDWADSNAISNQDPEIFLDLQDSTESAQKPLAAIELRKHRLEST